MNELPCYRDIVALFADPMKQFMSMRCVEAEQTVLTACSSPPFLWLFEGPDGDFRASEVLSHPSHTLLTPGSILGNRTGVILGRKPEKP